MIEIETYDLDYKIDDKNYKGYVAHPPEAEALNTILIASAWDGRSELSCKHAEKLAQQGYTCFVLDVYGDGKVGQNPEENESLMKPLVQNREELLKRLKGGYEKAIQLKQVNVDKVVALGFCFGGLCVLDMARAGFNLKGVVSFHGLYSKPNEKTTDINSKVLILHGYKDPLIGAMSGTSTQQQVELIQEELTQRNCDWQFISYGNGYHAFTNPNANDKNLGTLYDTLISSRSWEATGSFLNDCFCEI